MNHLLKNFKGFSIFIFFGLLGCQELSESYEKISMADDGMLIIDGKRKFIIGSYHHPKVEYPFLNLAANGYNFVKVSADGKQLDSAAKYGLMTWISTGSIRENNEEDSSRISKLVNKFKNQSSLLCWEIEDEPAFTWNSEKARIKPENMRRTFSLIKNLDKQHLVYTNHAPVNLVSTLRKYNDATDIVACDVYPVIPHGIKPTYALFPDGLQGDLLNTYLSQVGEYVDKMKKVAKNKKPIFMVLQGFAWEMLKPNGSKNLSMIKYPTFAESRFMAYNAIVHGATGIIYWGTNYTPQPSKFIEDLNRLTSELGENQSILSSSNYDMDIKMEYHELGYSVDTGIEFIVKNVNSKIYLLCVNSDKNPVKVSFVGLNNFKSAVVLKEGRTIEVIDDELTDNYQPFDVHLYELIN